MLKLYQARENVDREKFIYEHIDGETLVIVPDQYTLIAEEQAMKYLHTDCLLDVEILSMSRLGLRMLEEQGRENARSLDQYERFMLLARVIRRERDSLEIFRKSADKKSFIEMISDYISDFKQQECREEDVRNLIESPETGELLRRKLEEIQHIVDAYQEEIEGKYIDTEDVISMYIEAIGETESMRSREIWVYGFDSMTPKFMDAVTELAGAAKNVSVMVNVSDFGLDQILIGALTEMADRKHIRISEYVVHEDFLLKSETLRRIEEGLFRRVAGIPGAPGSQPDPSGNTAYRSSGGAGASSFLRQELRVVECANMYNEAESAAIYVYGLLREGYRMKDIVLISNDTDVMQPIVERTFREYGLPLFLDARRSVSDSQAVGFVSSLLDLMANGYRTSSVLTLLKSDLTGMERERIWRLENYARDYGIRGTMWSRPFRYGTHEYSEEEFEELERSRAEITGKIDPLREIGKTAENAGDFIRKLYQYLDEVWNFRDRIQAIQEEQQERKLYEEAEWTAQSYNAVIQILGCVGDILGEEPLDAKEFSELFGIGIQNAEVGLIPPSLDGLTIGTMIRTRPAPPRAVVILGANEGVLPMEPAPEGLFSMDEKAWFTQHAFPLGHLDDLKLLEENVAMYRMTARASDRLYVSYSLSDSDGTERKPSELIRALQELFPELTIEKDPLRAGFRMELIQNESESLRHMMNHFKERPGDRMAETVSETGEEAAADEAAYLAEGIVRWCEAHEPETIAHLSAAGCDENAARPLPASVAEALYSRHGSFSLSASRLERYQHCPFEFFVMYGLGAEEPRQFRSGGREIGDIYHECIMRVSKRLRDLVAGGANGNFQSSPEYSDQAKTESPDPAQNRMTAPLTAGADPNSEPESDGRTGIEDPLENGNSQTAPENSTKARMEPLPPKIIASMVDEELSRLSDSYRGGLFLSGGRETYRMDRIREICEEAVLALAEQLRTGRIRMSYFEEPFGRGCRFEPIEYTLHGKKVYIEGKIDRVDILEDGAVRIVDYKTGRDELDLDQMRMGYKMQLMVYLQGATGAKREPAGMFYFNIRDSEIAANSLSGEKQEKQLETEQKNRFRLNGALVDDTEILQSMPESALGRKCVRLAPDAFDRLTRDVHKTIELLSDEIVAGEIPISPTRLRKNKRAECAYCRFRAVCRFDLSYRENSYRMV